MSQKIVRNVLAKGALTIFNLVLPLAVMPYIYRTISPLELGKIEFATTIVTYFSMFGMLGIYNYGLREMSSIRNDFGKSKYLYKQLFVIGLISNIFSSICLVLVTFFVDEVTKEILYIQLMLVFSQIFYVEWVNEAFERYSFITFKTILVRGGGYLSILILVASSEDYKVYVWILSLMAFVNYFISFLYIRHNFSNLNANVDISFIKRVIPSLFLILLLNNTNLFYTVLDRFLLGLKSGLDVAYYCVGQKLSDMLKAFLLIVVVVSIPRMSLQLRVCKERYEINVNNLINLLFLLVLPIASLFFLLSKEIVLLFAGENYLASIPSLRVFAIRIVVITLEAVLYNQIIFLHKCEKDLLKMNILCGFINLVLNLALFAFLNPFLAILTTLISEVIFQALCLWYIRNKIGLHISYFKKEYLCYLLLSVSFVLWVYIAHKIFISPFTIILFSCLLCFTTYAIGLHLLKDKMYLLLYKKITGVVC